MAVEPITKQGENPDQTRLMAEIGLEAASLWRVGTPTIPLRLFTALCELVLERPDLNDEGFDPITLYNKVGESFPSWSIRSSRDQETISRMVRKNWSTLVEKHWPERVEGMQQFAVSEGQTTYPKPDKLTGGGTGNTSKYKLIFPTVDTPNDQALNLGRVPVPDGLLYTCSRSNQTPWLSRVIFGTNLLQGHRRWLLLSTMLFTIFIALVILWFGFSALTTHSETGAAVRLLLNTAFLLWGLWYTVGPIYRVLQERIVKAPWWLQSSAGGELLEFRSPPLYDKKSLLVVRYSAKCPICGSLVNVQTGAPEHRGRLIGRCESAPKSHTFSFDHVTREGQRIPF